ncbi:endonuclease/exonuclease/phosphatase family protein [Dongia sp.]|uniref:endonuclease/exonuclease/phosphatase family protein n=1 Tax=Dongia sp. TaxID=1977262 RepID=UPI0035B1CEC3
MTGNKRRRGAFLRGLHAGLGLGGIILVIVTFLPLLHPYWPLAGLTEHFALQVLMAATVLSLLALALKRWRWFGLLLGIACIELWTIHPYWPSFLTGPRSALAGEGAQMKIVSLNVWHKGQSYAAVRDYLSRSGADMIGLVEVTPRWKAELAPLRALYPYSIDCQDRNPRCEEMLLSKYPFVKSFSGHINKTLPVIAWGQIAAPGNGTPLTFAVTHLSWPVVRTDLGDGEETVQAEQARNLAHALQKLGPNLVLMGDFNGAPWSRVQQDLRQATGLDNQGFLAPSWPAWGPAPVRLPIDHIMARGQTRLATLHPGPDVGSDHLPVEAIIGFAQP